MVNLQELTPGMYARAVFGSSRDSNNLMADGMPMTHPQRGSIQGFDGVHRNWLQEVQVIALGANAEYGEDQSAARARGDLRDAHPAMVDIQKFEVDDVL